MPNTNPARARDFTDPRIPNRDECVLRYLVDRWAVERPDKVHVVWEDGEEWTFADVRRRITEKAAGLEKLGVRQGDFVAVWLPNGRDALLAFYAINYLGAVFVPFNTAYRGNLLAHVVANSGAKLIIAHPDLVGRMGEIDRAGLAQLVLTTQGDAPDVGLEVTRFDDLAGDAVSPLDRPIQPWDIQSIIYTSGTTGPSKGVLSSYLHMFSNAGPESWPMVGEDDRYMCVAPIFHIGGMGPPFVMLARGASVAMVESFSTDRFWEIAARTKATVVFLLGVMATFLMKRPPSPEDRNHTVRKAFMVPLTDDAPAFTERFGIDIYTIFNMTEISSPIVSEANPVKRGTCGKARPGVEVRLVDANDCEVPVGEIGEMLVRTDRPWGMNSGYNRNPEATAKAWGNGWFHTGDAFRQDEDGYFYFVDRVKDAIRRRGENISSFEVEVEVCAHPAVREAAAIAVPSEFSEDEVMVVVAPVPGQAIDVPELARFLIDRMPYFMVPRYIRVMDELPKTPSAKVLKADLRSEGVTADTWDREKAGMRVRRESFAG
ncbi:AMP-dependent synthetase and ligase [Novosphingobium aromaticivorans DSM 12444]|uniref:AMP-dependent synthetase and ligase n=1 Tax=Novosphingobium aromaticivorans (strain ATCC 700278 / DSM 12444 / CCUG 56034 / CIP 105152 / NBRC 16084 / F199) TaxID=279238 RepID=Q2G5I4_NOVAD|nr:AMP-binding protein [Novosphingobium aromaticivorans]ABD26889.1 AMP-dependent synthetase and ligase [Novosphingobium aromaticivorans DSM 12444]SCY44692.1 crotonobetaine/carnitine-CoA ligase [Novosphingobium aromaticivorans]